jgi:hypothetical protein
MYRTDGKTAEIKIKATGTRCDAGDLMMVKADGWYFVKSLWCTTKKQLQYLAGNKNEWEVFFKGVKVGTPEEIYMKTLLKKKVPIVEIIEMLTFMGRMTVEDAMKIKTVAFNGKGYPVREVRFNDGTVVNVATVDLKKVVDACLVECLQSQIEANCTLSDLAFSIDNEIVYYAEPAEFCLSIEELEAIIYN